MLGYVHKIDLLLIRRNSYTLKNKRFTIIIGFILVLSISLFIVLNLYNKPLLNIAKSRADLEIMAQEILDDYRTNENIANKKYVDNVIQIKGEILDITIENGNGIISLKDLKGESSVMCHMSPEENLKVLKLQKDSVITIKGVCTGYLLDVVLVRCIIINN